MRKERAELWGVAGVLLGAVMSAGMVCAQDEVPSEPVAVECSGTLENVETVSAEPENGGSSGAETAPAEMQNEYGEEADVHELQELVVQSRRAVVEGRKLVVVPTKTEKKLADSPASLVDQMQFPGVTVKDDAILSIDGQSVAVFINGVRANNVDYQTFWPKNTVRVEYLFHPVDPEFEGEARVMNFIVAEPKTGGVTRLKASQTFPGRGNYDVSSKLVTGRMTYGFNFNGRYWRDHIYTDGEEGYKNLWYGGEHYDRISRAFSGHQDFRLNTITTALNARYKKEKLVMTHALALDWTEWPDNDGLSTQVWTPGLFDAPTVRTQSSSRRLTPQVSGNYHVGLGQLVWLHANWQYNYTDGRNSSGYAQEGYAPLYNDTREKVHSITVGLSPSIVKENKWMVALSTQFQANLYKTLYTGTADTDQRMDRYDFTGGVSFVWNVTPLLAVMVVPGVTTSTTKVAEISTTEVKPTVSAAAQWALSSKVSLNASAQRYMRTLSPSNVNPVMTQISDLEWQVGNPDLKNGGAWSYNLSGNYLCSNVLTLSWNVMYENWSNDILKVYTPNSPSTGGVLGTFVNAGNQHKVMVFPNLNLRLFNNKLNVTLSPNYTYTHCTPIPSETRTLSDFSGWGRVSATIKNVGLALNYSTRSAYLTYGGFEKRKRPDSLGFSVSYGTGDFYGSLSVSNILHKKYTQYIYYTSPTFDRTESERQLGRSVTVSVTYYVGYGKKTDRSIEIESVNAAQSSVL